MVIYKDENTYDRYEEELDPQGVSKMYLDIFEQVLHELTSEPIHRRNILSKLMFVVENIPALARQDLTIDTKGRIEGIGKIDWFYEIKDIHVYGFTIELSKRYYSDMDDRDSDFIVENLFQVIINRNKPIEYYSLSPIKLEDLKNMDLDK